MTKTHNNTELKSRGSITLAHGGTHWEYQGAGKWLLEFPLPEDPEGWIQHDGKSMPNLDGCEFECRDGYRKVCRRGTGAWNSSLNFWLWHTCDEEADQIVRYRTTAKPKMVPLEMKDIPPGSVLKCQDEPGWTSISDIHLSGVMVADADLTLGRLTWLQMQSGRMAVLIHRLGDVTRTGDLIWRKCEKPEGGALPKLGEIIK